MSSICLPSAFGSGSSGFPVRRLIPPWLEGEKQEAKSSDKEAVGPYIKEKSGMATESNKTSGKDAESKKQEAKRHRVKEQTPRNELKKEA